MSLFIYISFIYKLKRKKTKLLSYLKFFTNPRRLCVYVYTSEYIYIYMYSKVHVYLSLYSRIS